MVYLNMGGVIVNIILNMLLIPLFRVEGAAIASLLTQIFTNVFMGIILKPLRQNNILLLRAVILKINF